MTRETREIRVRYRSCDGFSKSGKWKTVKAASRFARKWVGETPENGTFYAVSADGVGRVTWEGVTFGELFPAAESLVKSWRKDLESNEEREDVMVTRYDAPYTEEDAMRDEEAARFDDNQERYAAELADLDEWDRSEEEAIATVPADEPMKVWYPNGNPAEVNDNNVPF